MHPGAERWKFAVEYVSARVELRLGPVVVVGSPQRTDDCHVVDAASHVRYPVAQLNAAVAVLSEADLQRIQLLPQLDVEGHFAAIEPLGLLRVGVGGLADRLAGVPGDLRFRIERLRMRNASIHKQPNDALGLGGEVRVPIRRLPGFRLVGFEDAVFCQHRAERQAREAEAEVGQKCAARRTKVLLWGGAGHVTIQHDYRTVMKSL
jgi:hypothetical protein